MKRRPEQLQAESYAHRKGTTAPMDDIRRKVRDTFGRLEDLLDGLSAEAASVAPAAGKWSVHEIVDHLVVSHQRAVDELRGLIAGRAPTTSPIPEGLLSADPWALSWKEQLAALKAVHRRFLETLDLASDDTSLDVKAPIVMVVRCAMADGTTEPVRWIESFDWKAYAILFRAHTLEHVQQIGRALRSS